MRGECETCFMDNHCPNTYYCCPVRRKCVKSDATECKESLSSVERAVCLLRQPLEFGSRGEEA